MVVVADGHDKRLVRLDALHIIPPFPSNLDSQVHSLRPGVHRKREVQTKHRTNLLTKQWVPLIMESARGDGQLLTLVHHDFEDARVAVALVDNGEGAEEVDVFFAIDVPESGTLATGENDGQGLEAVGCITLFEVDVVLGGEGKRLYWLLGSMIREGVHGDSLGRSKCRRHCSRWKVTGLAVVTIPWPLGTVRKLVLSSRCMEIYAIISITALR
jgi:hypothetical protein